MTQKQTVDADVLEVAFVPTAEDLAEAMHATIYRGRRPWAEIVMVLVLGLNVVVGLARHGVAALLGTAGFALLVLVLGTAAYRGGPVFARWALARRAVREPHLLAPMAYRLGPDGVRVKSADGVSRLPWSGVARVRETRHLFFFELGGKSSLYVPRRVLSGPEQSRLRRLLVARMGARAQVQTYGR